MAKTVSLESPRSQHQAHQGGLGSSSKSIKSMLSMSQSHSISQSLGSPSYASTNSKRKNKKMQHLVGKHLINKSKGGHLLPTGTTTTTTI